MRKPWLGILSTFGIVLMCAMIVIEASIPLLYPQLVYQPISEVGPLELAANTHGLWIIHQHGKKILPLNLFYPATVLGALSLAYPLVEASRKRRSKRGGFPVILPDMPDSKS